MTKTDPTPTEHLSALREAILAKFNLEEVRTLVFDLSVNYDDLRGDTISAKVQALLEHLEKRGRVLDLLALLKQLRPKENWDSFLPAQPDAHSPYKGLQFFDEEDADLFFGREQLTAELVDYLRNYRFLAIVGASGSGKSSVVRAGVIPKVKSGAIAEDGLRSGTWKVHIITPTEHPLQTLATSLTHDSESVTAAITLADDLRQDSRSLDIYVSRLLEGQPNSHILLVVDQFEELFTQCDDLEERRLFVENLVTAVTSGKQGRLLLILTLRADFYAFAVQYESLRPLLETRQKIVGAMNQEELRQAIEGPAQETGWQLQPGLVDTMLQAVGREPGALPLLSHALQETWEQREGRVMTLAGYHAAGGVRRAIAQTADTVYARLTPEEQTIVRNIFLRLTELGEGTEDTRRRASLAELLPQGEMESAVQGLLDLLTRKRLVTLNEERSGGDSSQIYAEVAHEALIREWPALREWLDEDREGLLIHRRLTNAAQEWQENRQEASLLYRGLRLAEAEHWVQNNPHALSAQERIFLETSLEAEQKRQRNLRIFQIGMLVTLVIVIVLGLGAVFISSERNKAVLARETAVSAQSTSDANAQFSTTKEAEAIDARATSDANAALAMTHEAEAVVAEADAATSRDQAEQQRQIISLIAQSQALMTQHLPTDQDIVQARLLAVAASQIDVEDSNISFINTWQERLARNWPKSNTPISSLADHTSWVNSVAWNEEGTQLASGSCGQRGDFSCVQGEIIIWDTTTWQPMTTLTDHSADVNSVAWNADGTRLASGSDDTNIIIWNTTTWQPVTILTGHLEQVFDLAWNDAGTRLASAGNNNQIIIWDTTTWQPVTTLMDHSDAVYSVAWNKDGTRLASGSFDGNIIIWDTITWQPVTTLNGHFGIVFDVAWNENGTRLASASDDTRIKIWDTTTWQLLTILSDDLTDGVLSIAWNEDGTRLASGSFDDKVIIWDSATWQPVTALTGHTSGIFSVAWNEDGTRLASGSDDTNIIIWNTATWRPATTLKNHTSNIWDVAWNRDGTQLASGLVDGSILIWDIATWQPIATLTNHRDRVYSVAWNADGTRLASGSEDTSVIIWDSATWQPVATLTDPTNPVSSVAWNGDGTQLASAMLDNSIIIWDTATWQPVTTLNLTHELDWVWSVAWNEDGTRLASGSEDGIIIWNTTTWQSVTDLTNNTSGVRSVAWNSDGTMLASGSIDESIIIWNATTWQPITTLTGHNGNVFSVTWNRDGTRLASSSNNHKIILWDTASWQPVTTLIGNANGFINVAWTWDGTQLASGDDRNIIVWENADQVWFRRNCELAGRNFTPTEWQKVFGNEPYRIVCPQFPALQEQP